MKLIIIDNIFLKARFEISSDLLNLKKKERKYEKKIKIQNYLKNRRLSVLKEKLKFSNVLISICKLSLNFSRRRKRKHCFILGSSESC